MNVNVQLTAKHSEILRRVSAREYRPIKSQARYLLEQALEELGEGVNVGEIEEIPAGVAGFTAEETAELQEDLAAFWWGRHQNHTVSVADFNQWPNREQFASARALGVFIKAMIGSPWPVTLRNGHEEHVAVQRMEGKISGQGNARLYRMVIQEQA